MLFVRKPMAYSVPGTCILIPGRRADEDGFIDSATELDGANGPIRPYISVAGIRKAASQFPQLGLKPAAEYDALARELSAAQAEADALRAENAKLQANLDRVAGLSRNGFKVSKVMGRPKVQS